MTARELAQKMHVRYVRAVRSMHLKGHSVCAWDKLSKDTQEAWIEAAREAVDCVRCRDVVECHSRFTYSDR